MSAQDKFERLLEALHAAMLDETLWPTTAPLLDEACGTVGTSFILRDGAQADSRVTYLGLYYRGERREDWEREYLGIYHPINESVARFRQLPDNSVVPTPALYTAAELKTSATYNESLRKGHSQNGLSIRLLEPDGSHIAWHPHDPVDPTGWGSAQLAMVHALRPHIRQFVRVRQALVRAEALNASLTTLLDNTRVGVLHLDRRGRVIEANDRARAYPAPRGWAGGPGGGAVRPPAGRPGPFGAIARRRTPDLQCPGRQWVDDAAAGVHAPPVCGARQTGGELAAGLWSPDGGGPGVGDRAGPGGAPRPGPWWPRPWV